MANTITLVVPGQAHTRGEQAPGAAQFTEADAPFGRVRQSVRPGALRAGGALHRMDARVGRDIVAFHIHDGPTLYLHPENALALLKGQALPEQRDAGMPDASLADGEVMVPPRLQWRGLHPATATRAAARGVLGDVLLDRIDIISDAAAGVVAEKVVEQVDAQVVEGVYALQPERLEALKGKGRPLARVPNGAGELLVLVHGTFSNTEGTFGKLWLNHPHQVQALFERYGQRVFALDHRTLGVSPISNALTLARALPDGARVHLLTHSRGGLVAEALARACGTRDLAADLRHFEGAPYAAHRAALEELYRVAERKKLRIERVVRVACPARGTMLASKRLDAYLSVFQWGLKLAGLTVLPALVDFLAQVAARRADPATIPGLAAQIPDSPFIEWLHDAPDPVPGDLRVVAGDLEGDSVVSWVKTLLADSFYWTDNDLVVQTRSMYGGVPRAAGASFVLDQGGKVNHFNYFANESSASAIVQALVDGDTNRFRPIGPESWAGESATGLRARRAAATPDPAKPAVFILPGILGSNLNVRGKRVWVGPRLLFSGLTRLELKPGDGVEPDGPMAMYDDLAAFLSETHEVIPFGYDWRQPLEREAVRLAEAVDAAVAAREATGQPVCLLAHSMGGLLARTMFLERPDVWRRMMSHPDARLLMLGTPNGGSWAPMQVLSGDDLFGNLLVSVGALFQDHKARTMMAAFPGFLQLQAALTDANLGLDTPQAWKRLADEDMRVVLDNNAWHTENIQLSVYEWGIPTRAVLESAVKLRRRLDQQLQSELGPFTNHLSLVLGHADFTPDGYELTTREGLVYRAAQESGDGRVTVASACIPGVRTWKAQCVHGKLPEEKAAYGAYRELLVKGETTLLPRFEPPVARGAGTAAAAEARPAAIVRMRPSREGSSGLPPTRERDLLAPSGEGAMAPARERGRALPISVVNGDLSFIGRPLLLGHYESTRLTGTEAVMDRLVGGAMSRKLKARSYPGMPGTSHVFLNRNRDVLYPGRVPRPESVIVAGLGPENELRPAQLVHTVRQAVIEWAQREAEKLEAAGRAFELAATLLASGGSGITAGQAAQLIVQGVREANERLEEIGWPQVGHLMLIELYLDRAVEAWRSLKVQAAAEPARYRVDEAVTPGMGAMRRPLDASYRSSDYDLIAATTARDAAGAEVIAFTLDTRRARTELRAQALQGPLVRRLVASASVAGVGDKEIGRTLFRLLVPLELEPFLSGSTEVLLEVDPGTAAIPWELLDAREPHGGDKRPWAIRSKLIRKLRLEQFREQVIQASTDARVLVIGEPKCDTREYPRLPGARAEAREVVKRLTAPGALAADVVTALIAPDDEKQEGPDARAVINALMAHDWRIVHISGHGMPPRKKGPPPANCDDPEPEDADPRGVVLSDCTFLGPREIQGMRVVPELVFVNCCHLAARNPGQTLALDHDRARFAANVAEQLIRIGVKCIIAAGWAVDDRTASLFATRFYDALLRGRRFIDAVAEAREAAFSESDNTWAAYQCYGDPDWVFEPGAAGGQATPPALPMRYGGIGSALGLENALETLTVRTNFQHAKRTEVRAHLKYLEDRFAARWGGIGSVATMFGEAWAAVRDLRKAIEWYDRAVAAEDGSAGMVASEQAANLRARLAWEELDAARGGDGRVPQSRATAARRQIDDAIGILQRLVEISPTLERLSALGSAWKLLAMAQQAGGAATATAVAGMRKAYGLAAEHARQKGLPNIHEPLMNLVAAQLASRPRGGKPLLDEALLDEAEAALDRAMRDDPDFRAAAGKLELRIYRALLGGFTRSLPAILAEAADLRTRVSAPKLWAPVRDQFEFATRLAFPRMTKADAAAVAQLRAMLDELAGIGSREG